MIYDNILNDNRLVSEVAAGFDPKAFAMDKVSTLSFPNIASKQQCKRQRSQKLHRP